MLLVRFTRRHMRSMVVGLSLLASLIVLAVGIIRWHNYSVLMTRGEYAAAARPASFIEDPDDPDADLQPFAYKPTVNEKFLDQLVRYARNFVDVSVGSRAYAAYDNAYVQYDLNRFPESLRAFQVAYVHCCDGSGAVRPEYVELASDIKLLIGNCHQHMHKKPEAIAAYEEALKLNDGNRPAIFEMEKLKVKEAGGGGGGKEGGDKPAGGNPNSRRKI